MAIKKTNLGRNVSNSVEFSTKLFQWLIQIVAIIAMIALCMAGFVKLWHSFSLFSDTYLFLQEVLHSLEILFISPLPILIIYSYKPYILELFPSNTSMSFKGEFISQSSAEIAFVSSLIGITSTFVIGKLIELLNYTKPDINTQEFTPALSNCEIFITIGLALIFLIIQIFLFRFLSHKKRSNSPPFKDDQREDNPPVS